MEQQPLRQQGKRGVFWEAVSHDSTEAAVAGDVVKGKRKSPNEGFMNEHQRQEGRQLSLQRKKPTAQKQTALAALCTGTYRIQY